MALFLKLVKQHEFSPHGSSGDCDFSGLAQFKQEECKSRGVNLMLHPISNHPKRLLVNARVKVGSRGPWSLEWSHTSPEQHVA